MNNKLKNSLVTGVTAVSVLAGVGLASVPAQAITLDRLLAGETITVGDKLFSDWSLGSVTNVNPSNIDITGIDAGTDQPGPGLMYSFLNGELSLGGPGVEQIFFNYKISVLDPDKWITDNSLRGDFTVTGPNAKAEAHEFIYEDAARTIEALGSDPFHGTPSTHEKDVLLELDDDSLPAPNSQNIDGIDFFKQYKELYVTKEFSVDVSDPDGTAAIDNIKQNFSQTTPEPSATLGLLALGGLGLLKQRKKQK
jgi:hypothetical protein